MNRKLRRWLVAQVLASVALALGLLLFREGLAEWVTLRLPRPHAVFKAVAEVWGLWLLHREALPYAVGAGALLGAVLSGASKRVWLAIVALGTVALAAALSRRQLVAVAPFLALVSVGVAPAALVAGHPRLFRVLAWIPGAWLLLPAALARHLGGPRWLAAAAAVASTSALCGAGFAASVAGLHVIEEHHIDFVHWPDRMLDPRIEVLDRSPGDVAGDVHEIQITADRAWVPAEASGRLLEVPLPGGPIVAHAVPVRRQPIGSVGSVSSWADEATGIVWIMTDFQALTGFVHDGARLVPARRASLPGRMNFPYLRWAEGRGRLLLVEVYAENRSPGRIASVDVRGGAPVEQCWLHRADNQPFGSPRGAVWVPPLDRLVISPDYDPWLYLVDPRTCVVEPWLDTGGFHGRMTWVPEWGRLLVSTPGASYVPVIDPAGPTIERRIPTQPGVRTLAVDVERDLLITASVVTGAVLIQRASTGEELDRLATIMPMVRDLQLSRSTGLALLSTWTVLYRFPYTGDAAR